MKKRLMQVLGLVGIPTLLVTFIRIIAIVFHNTQLERLYKPGQWRRSSRPILDQAVLDELPKYCQSLAGLPMDPINFIFLGEEKSIRRIFKKAGWHSAHPATPVHLLLGFFSALFNKSYRSGPFTPLFLSIGLQDMALQKPTARKSFRQRHHIRVWRTQVHLPKGQRVWVAAASFDTNLKFSWGFPFVHHHIEANLDVERAYIMKDLERMGARLLELRPFNEEIKPDTGRRNAYGETYFTDGRVAVIEVPDAA